MSSKRIRFTFPPDLITRPIIYEMGHKFEVVTNIRRAEVREVEGWVVLELVGEDAEIAKSLQWVDEMGVRVDPVSGDVLQG